MLRLSISDNLGLEDIDGLKESRVVKNTTGTKMRMVATASGPLKNINASKSGLQATNRATGLTSRV